MASRRSHPFTVHEALLAKSLELALAAPQVMAHRLWRMALAGPMPSARDRAEFQRMGLEKLAAFFESWQAMSWQLWQIQLGMLASLMRLWQPGWPGPQALSGSFLQEAVAGVLGAGLAPVHRRASANARRLARSRTTLFTPRRMRR